MFSLNPLDGIMQTWLYWVIPGCKDIVVSLGIAFYIWMRVTLHQSNQSRDLPGVLEFRRSFASSSFDHLLLLTAGLELFLLVLPLFIEYKRFFTNLGSMIGCLATFQSSCWWVMQYDWSQVQMLHFGSETCLYVSGTGTCWQRLVSFTSSSYRLRTQPNSMTDA